MKWPYVPKDLMDDGYEKPKLICSKDYNTLVLKVRDETNDDDAKTEIE